MHYLCCSPFTETIADISRALLSASNTRHAVLNLILFVLYKPRFLKSNPTPHSDL